MNLKSPSTQGIDKIARLGGGAARVIYIFINTYRLYREEDFTLLKKC
jgi:hypothetical protein